MQPLHTYTDISTASDPLKKSKDLLVQGASDTLDGHGQHLLRELESLALCCCQPKQVQQDAGGISTL